MTLATLDVKGSYVLARERSARVVESDWTQGVHRVAQVVPYVVQRWTVGVVNDPHGVERAKVQTMWDARMGPAGVFEWTPPGGSATPVRFARDSFDPVQQSATAHAFEFRLEEALNHDG